MPRELRQAGAIPYRWSAAGLEVLLVTTTRVRRRWQLPKGMLMAQLSEPESAAREAAEEAGAVGVIHPEPVTSYTYLKDKRIPAEVFLYPLEVTHLQGEQWEERGQRERAWFPVKEAVRKVKNPGIKVALLRFRRWAKAQRLAQPAASAQ